MTVFSVGWKADGLASLIHRMGPQTEKKVMKEK